MRTERYIAQDKARRNLMPMYRNPSLDDPSVKGLSRSTANTHVIQHRHLLLALKEDSPPSALDLNTLETIDPVYTFDGQLPRDQPFTAHPKVCSTTGNIVAFGYEARGLGSDVIAVFEIDRQGRKVEHGHPNALRRRHPRLRGHRESRRLLPHADVDRRRADEARRHPLVLGSGQEIAIWASCAATAMAATCRWIEGPTRGGSHTLGAFEDNGKLYFDREITAANPYPVILNRDGTPHDAAAGTSYLHRLTVNLNGRNSGYGIEKMYPPMCTAAAAGRPL